LRPPNPPRRASTSAARAAATTLNLNRNASGDSPAAVRRCAMNAIELERRYSAHNYAPLPVVLTRGQGAHLWDTAGRRYVDMMSAYSAASHGHGHPRILAALTAPAGRAPGWALPCLLKLPPRPVSRGAVQAHLA